MVQGNFNQIDSRFGESRGKQCSCMALASICMTKIRKPSIWKELDLDFILTQGDVLYKSTGIDRTLYCDELPTVFCIENNLFQIEYPYKEDKFQNDENQFNNLLDNCYFSNASVTGAIVFINGYCISILKHNDFLFVFDSHSRDVNGQPTPEGTSILMKFKSIETVKTYLLNAYPSCTHFQIVFVEINDITDKEKKSVEKVLSRFKRRVQNNVYYSKHSEQCKIQSNANYEKNRNKRKRQFRKNYTENSDKRNEQSKNNYAKKRKIQPKDSNSRVKKFKSAILEGPFYVCVSSWTY